MAFDKNLLDISAESTLPGERVSRRQYFVANAISIGLVLVALAATPFAKLPLLPIPSYMTGFGTSMFVINVLLAAFLFSKGAIENREDAVRLGTAYFFIAAIFVPLTAAFPGGILPEPLIGTSESAIWLWSYWHLGFGLAILRYALLARPTEGATSVPGAICGTLAVVLLATLSATIWVGHLPVTLGADRELFSGWTALLPLSSLGVLALATAAVARLGSRTPEQLWLGVGMIAACCDVWLTYCGTERFSLGWYLAKLGSVFTSLTVMISLFHDVTRLYGRLAAMNGALRDLAERDGLTGLFNRRRLDEALAVEWLRAQRDRQPLSVLMIDVDHFKGFNDTYGHQEGDACLKRLATTLQGAVRRPADLVARYGGEEFVVCLPATPPAGAFAVADHIRSALGDLAIPHAASPLHVVTVSIGIAGMVPQEGTSADELLAAADTGLYRAKSAGRDGVMQADVRIFQPSREVEAVAPWVPTT